MGLPRRSATRSPGSRLPGFDFVERFSHLAGLFLHDALKVVAHSHAVELRLRLVVPLLEPGEQLDQAGQERHQALVVTTAQTLLDVHVIAADGTGKLQMVVAGPGDCFGSP